MAVKLMAEEISCTIEYCPADILHMVPFILWLPRLQSVHISTLANINSSSTCMCNCALSSYWLIPQFSDVET